MRISPFSATVDATIGAAYMVFRKFHKMSNQGALFGTNEASRTGIFGKSVYFKRGVTL